MKANSLHNWTGARPEPILIPKPRRQKPGVVKLLAPPTPPDENTIRKLNVLASKHPFCVLHRVKKHDML
ncbi:MAG TPA: hypothetical protein VG052_09560 [Puia sp.]|jgi:hypothetical protein|nr:hypothetical protein [Puia sp.]